MSWLTFEVKSLVKDSLVLTIHAFTLRLKTDQRKLLLQYSCKACHECSTTPVYVVCPTRF